MPTPCFISIKGKDQALITEGASSIESLIDCSFDDHLNEMPIQEFDHSVLVPINPRTNQPSGQPVHKAFKFSVTVNKAVPLLYNALIYREKLPEVELNWYRTGVEGRTDNYFRITLKEASIIDMRCELAHCDDPDNASYAPNITISMSYRKIFWSHISGLTVGSSDLNKLDETKKA